MSSTTDFSETPANVATIQVSVGILPASRVEEAQIIQAKIYKSCFEFASSNFRRDLRVHADSD